MIPLPLFFAPAPPGVLLWFSTIIKVTINYKVRVESMFTLTDQEYNIVTLVAKGYSAKQIAKKLYITRNTLSGHLQRLYTALNLEGDNRHLIKVVALYHQGKIKPGKRDNTAYTEAVKLIKEGERVTDIARRTGYTTSGISKIKQKITGSRQ